MSWQLNIRSINSLTKSNDFRPDAAKIIQADSHTVHTYLHWYLKIMFEGETWNTAFISKDYNLCIKIISLVHTQESVLPR